MSRIGFGLLAIVAVALGLVVGTFNADPVSLDLLWVQLNWPLGLLLLCAFSLGLMIGLLLLFMLQTLPLRLKLRRLEAEAARAETPAGSGPDA